MRGDDSGQMMLLSAIILMVGFMALGGMTARLAQVPQDTDQGRDTSFFSEASRVADGVRDAVLILAEDTPAGTTPHLDAVDAAMVHVRLVEAGRGFAFRAEPATCTLAGGGLVTVEVAVRLVGASSSIRMTISETVLGGPC